MSLLWSVIDVVKTVASKAIKGEEEEERAKAQKRKMKLMDGCSFRGRNKKQGDWRKGM